jgi:predicted adenylyl cyclase CyaB
MTQNLFIYKLMTSIKLLSSTQIIEKEIKILDVEPLSLSQKIELLGAKKVLDDLTQIKCFDITDNFKPELIPDKYKDISDKLSQLTTTKKLRDQNFHLRARKQANHFEFTLKYAVNSESTVKEEVEINIELSQNEWENIENILSTAGLEMVARQEKKRTSWIYEPLNLHLDMDTWPGVPTYLEIEGNTEQDIQQGIKLLGLEHLETSTESGSKLFARYGVNFYSNLVFNR